jgi:hypothetical protein
MLVDADFMRDFLALVHAVDAGVRLTASTSIFHTESSLRPLYVRFTQAQTNNEDLAWDPAVKTLIAAIPRAKQMKYSVAIKFVEKRFKNEQSKIFVSLRGPDGVGGNLSEKLSKSQQRYTMPLIAGDAGHGLCGQMALLWLQEQFGLGGGTTKFPRLENENVVKSQTAVDLTKQAMTLRRPGDTALTQWALRLGLTATEQHWVSSFDAFNAAYAAHVAARAFLVRFFDSQHAVAFFRQDAHYCCFYDSNAGSYRIPTANIRPFLLNYNNVCLPRKWPVYANLATTNFDQIYAVA